MVKITSGRDTRKPTVTTTMLTVSDKQPLVTSFVVRVTSGRDTGKPTAILQVANWTKPFKGNC